MTCSHYYIIFNSTSSLLYQVLTRRLQTVPDSSPSLISDRVIDVEMHNHFLNNFDSEDDVQLRILPSQTSMFNEGRRFELAFDYSVDFNDDHADTDACRCIEFHDDSFRIQGSA
jgi:hypothetical protein